MNSVEAAVMRTVLYADVFKFALTLDELHRYLIAPRPITVDTLRTVLSESSYLRRTLYRASGYIALAKNREHISLRCEREVQTQAMLPDAVRYGRWLSAIPFVRMVALTGALAMRNPASEADDFDYLLVTTPGRVWLARLFAVILVRLVRLRHRELCPNYVLASDQLVQQRQDLFIAHEVAQMQPIYGHTLYQSMVNCNHWMTNYLPNVTAFPAVKKSVSRVKLLLERLLGGTLGDWLEQWEYRRKQRKFQPYVQQPQSDALIDSATVKGHFDDHGASIIHQYRQRLADYGIQD